MDITRKQREELNELSLKLYGRKYAWQKMMKQGEWRDGVYFTKNSQPMKVKKHTNLSLEDVIARMNDQVKKNEDAVKKVQETKETKTEEVQIENT
jgi:hypothetical protein